MGRERWIEIEEIRAKETLVVAVKVALKIDCKSRLNVNVGKHNSA